MNSRNPSTLTIHARPHLIYPRLSHHCFDGTVDPMLIVVQGEKAVAFRLCQQHSLVGAAAKSSPRHACTHSVHHYCICEYYDTLLTCTNNRLPEQKWIQTLISYTNKHVQTIPNPDSSGAPRGFNTPIITRCIVQHTNQILLPFTYCEARGGN